MNPSSGEHSVERLNVVCKVMGGPTVGMGHVMRSLELAVELKLAEMTVVGFVCNEDRCSQALIAAADFRQWRDDEDLSALLTERHVDVLLLDHPQAPGEFGRRLKSAHPEIHLVQLDCSEMTASEPGVIVNLLNHHPTLLAPQSPSVQYFEGLDYAIIRREFLEVRDGPSSARRKPAHLLITFGGADPRGHTIPVATALAGLPATEVRLSILVGPNFSQRAAVLRFAAQSGANIYENVSEVAQLLGSADLAISGGGTTMLELACLGIPVVVIPQSPEEARFAASLARRGAALVCQPHAVSSDLRRMITGLLANRAARKGMRAAGRAAIDGQGKRRIAEIIKQHCAPTRRPCANY